jgi:choline transport protein
VYARGGFQWQADKRAFSHQGQYHYTYIIAPDRFKNFAAYVVGMINVIAWWINTASGTIYTAISAFGICEFLVPGFAGTQWQVYLCYLLVILLTRMATDP